MIRFSLILVFINVICVFFEIQAQNTMVIPQGHSLRINSVEFSPDERQVLTTSLDKTALLWDIRMGKTIQLFSGHTDGVNSGKFSHDGKYIVTTSSDRTIRIWDIESAKLIRTITGPNGGVITAEYSPNDSLIVSASYDGMICLWNANDGSMVKKWTIEGGYYKTVIFNATGTRILAGGTDNTAKLWDIESGKELQVFSGHFNYVNCVVFSPDESRILTASDDGMVGVWDISTGKLIEKMKGHEYDVTQVVFSHDGSKLLSSSKDESCMLWQVDGYKKIGMLTGFMKEVRSSVFNKNDSYILTLLGENIVCLRDAETGKILQRFPGEEISRDSDLAQLLNKNENSESNAIPSAKVPLVPKLTLPIGHIGNIQTIRECAKNKIVATYSDDHVLKIWDTRSGNLIQTYNVTLSSFEFSNNGNYIIGDSSSYPVVLDIKNGRRVIVNSDGSNYKVAINNKEDKLLVIFSTSLVIKDLPSMKTIKSFWGRYRDYCRPAFSQDDQKIALLIEDQNDFQNHIHVLNVNNLEQIADISLAKIPESIYCLDFVDGDSQLMARTLDDAMIFDLESGKIKLRTEKFIYGEGQSLNLDRNILAIAKENKTIVTYDLQSGTVMKRFSQQESDIRSISINLTSTQLLVSLPYKGIKIIDMVSEKELAFLPFNKFTGAALFSDDGGEIFSVENFGFKTDIFQKGLSQTFSNKVINYEYVAADPTNEYLFTRGKKTKNEYVGNVLSLDNGEFLLGLKTTSWYYPFSPDGSYIFQYFDSPFEKDPAYAINMEDLSIKSLDVYSGLEGVISPDEQHYFLSEGNNQSYIWDAKTITRKTKLIPNPSSYPVNVIFSNNAKYLAIPSVTDKLKVYEVETGKLINEFGKEPGELTLAEFSADGNQLITKAGPEKVEVWDVKSGDRITKLEGFYASSLNLGLIAHDAKKIIADWSNDISISTKCWDLETGKVVYTIPRLYVKDKILSPDQKQVLFSYHSCDTIFIYDVNTGIKSGILKLSSKEIGGFIFDKSGTRLYVADYDMISCFDWSRKHLLFSKKLHDLGIKGLQLAKDDSVLITFSDDCFLKLTDASDGKHLYSVVSFENSYVVFTPEGYYKGSKEDVSRINYSLGINSIPFEQLDIRYNRPDVVLKTIGKSDTALINSYYRAYLKRIKRLKIDTTHFSSQISTPFFEITNKIKIDYDQKQRELNIEILAKDTLFGLDRFNIWVNEVPVFGERGYSLKLK